MDRAETYTGLEGQRMTISSSVRRGEVVPWDEAAEPFECGRTGVGSIIDPLAPLPSRPGARRR